MLQQAIKNNLEANGKLESPSKAREDNTENYSNRNLRTQWMGSTAE